MAHDPSRQPPTAEMLIDAVRRHLDLVLERCRDRWHDTPLLADGLDLATGEPIGWEGHVLSDFACQQNLLRTLDGLAALTGDDRYRQRAEEWAAFALERLHEPESDLLYWGGHTAYDLAAAQPLIGNHELKCVYPYYPLLHRVAPERTARLVAGLWHAHVRDWSTLLFNRHGEYQAWDRSRAWAVAPYLGGPLPIVDNTLLSFINTGSDLVYAGGHLAALAGEPASRDWATRLLDRYEQIRHPETGLAGYQFNHREPCRVRASFRPPYRSRPEVNETTVITANVIRTRYGRVAVAFTNLAEVLGPEPGGEYLGLVVRDLVALAEHAWDPAAGAFHSILVDGTRLSPADTVEGAGYCHPQKLERVPACGVLLLAAARAYRLTEDQRLGDLAWAQLAGLGWTAGGPGRIPVEVERIDLRREERTDIGIRADQEAACALVGLLELWRATGDAPLLRGAERLAGELLLHGRVGGFFADDPAAGSTVAAVDSAVPLALLQLADALVGGRAALPALYPNQTYFDPKVIVARRQG